MPKGLVEIFKPDKNSYFNPDIIAWFNLPYFLKKKTYIICMKDRDKNISKNNLNHKYLRRY